MADAGRLAGLAAIGLLIAWAGATGRPGSVLAALIDPGAMVEGTPGIQIQTNGNGAVGGGGGFSSLLPTTGTLTPVQIAGYVKSAGFPAGSQQTAIAVALAESGGNVAAHNPGNGTTDIEDSYGLWQINRLAHPAYSAAKLVTPAYNAAAAYTISSGGTNWYPWGTYTSGAYLSHMTAAANALKGA